MLLVNIIVRRRFGLVYILLHMSKHNSTPSFICNVFFFLNNIYNVSHTLKLETSLCATYVVDMV